MANFILPLQVFVTLRRVPFEIVMIALFTLNQISDLCFDVISELKIVDENCLKYFCIILA